MRWFFGMDFILDAGAELSVSEGRGRSGLSLYDCDSRSQISVNAHGSGIQRKSPLVFGFRAQRPARCI